MICRRLSSTSANIQTGSRIISGIQPTGIPHIGNYLGFIQKFVKIQNEYDFAQKFLFHADYHSISVGLPPIGQLDQNVKQMTACLIACGIDPDKTVLFAQNQICEHTELSWILSSKQYISKLQRLTQFKDKSGTYTSSKVPLGLINYPVLQAADVLLYKGTHVPVGEDQTQHFNLIGQIAEKMNKFINEEFFPRPVMIQSNYPRIKSLRNPGQKMSKSDKAQNACIFITDSAELVQDKIRKAMTDSFRTIEYNPATRHGISNLLQIYAAFSDQSIEDAVEECKSLDTVAFKERTADAVNSTLEPIRQKYKKLIDDPSTIVAILSDGRDKAQKIAHENLSSLKKSLGFYIGQ